MADGFLPQIYSFDQTKPRRGNKKHSSRRKMIGKAVISEQATRLFAPITIERRRQNEIEDVIRFRHGSFVPDASYTDDVEKYLAYAKAIAMTPRIQRVDDWCAKWMPWAQAAYVAKLVKRQASRRFMAKADHVANMLSVTMELRTSLDLRTIGSCDVSEDERKAHAAVKKRHSDAVRQKEKRAAKGCVHREEYEKNSISKAKPWELEGLSRRTWYRRQKQFGTGPSRIDIDISVSDTLVPQANERAEISQSPFQEDTNSKVKP